MLQYRGVEPSEFLRLYPAAFYACHRNHAGESKLTARQWQLLAHLDREEPMRPTDLAKHLNVSAATVSIALDRLELSGFGERTPDARDGRVTPIRMTEAGHQAMLESSALDPTAVANLLAAMDEEERTVVRRALQIIERAAKRLPETPE
jgi:DNA-binding MarR family transcriptional regulator